MTMERQKENSNWKPCSELWLTLTHEEAIQLPLNKLDKVFK